MRVDWSSRAVDDLSEILRYVVDSFGADVALRVNDEIIGEVGLLARFPNMGKVYYNDGQRGITYRELATKHHRVLYYTEDEVLTVVMLWNNRRDANRLMARLRNGEYFFSVEGAHVPNSFLECGHEAATIKQYRPRYCGKENKQRQYIMSKHIGAHVSASGGVGNAILNAEAIGADAFALFTRNQRSWVSKPMAQAEVDGFRALLAERGFSPEYVLPHDSYLINLGSPDEETLLKSRAAFLDEMRRAQALGLRMVNFHPGSHLNRMSEEECLDQIAVEINRALSQTEGVTAVIENTAGQGTNLGWRFEHLARIIEGVDDKGRVGVCIDTCHTLAAGYDLTTEMGYGLCMDELERVVGLGYLRAVHLNDSKKGCGSHVDRHEVLGEGMLGREFFVRLMHDPRFDDMPIILETPDPTRWAEEIRWLRGL